MPEMAVVEAMIGANALLFMAAEPSENRQIVASLRKIGLLSGAQDIGAWETVPGWVTDGVPAPHEPDAVHGGFDASIEEILHCVTDQGASIVQPARGPSAVVDWLTPRCVRVWPRLSRARWARERHHREWGAHLRRRQQPPRPGHVRIPRRPARPAGRG